MKRILLATLVLGLAGTANAAPLKLNGSDTLYDFTKELIDPAGDHHCVDGSNNPIDGSKLTYDGGGSGLGEDNMAASPELQQIAPMSRWFKDTKAVAGVSQGCVVALDGIAIFADNSETNTCNTTAYSTSVPITVGAGDGSGCTDPAFCVGGAYQFSDWRDVLRIVYFGQPAHTTLDACTDGTVGSAAIATKNCNSDIRATIVNNWSKLFQENTGCNGTDPDACATLRHAFRRDDASGTTDLFVSVLGGPKLATTGSQSRPFCNGAEMEDEDPIRRDCSEVVATGDEQVCNATAKSLLGPSNVATFGSSSEVGWRGGPTANPPNNTSADLGLVQPIVIPQTLPYQDITACSVGPSNGSFRYAPMPAGAITAAQQKCPDGTGPFGGYCAWPARKVGTSYFLGCVNKKGNLPVALVTASGMTNIDGRVYNLIARNPDGTMQTVERVIANVARQLPVHHAIYRIHETAVMPGGTPDPTFATGCRFADATDQIGCLVHASPCSIGYAGLGGGDALNKELALRVPLVGASPAAVKPTPLTVQRLTEPSGPGCGAAGAFDIRYPLSRKLYYNARKGFGGASFANISNTNEEQDLVKCACDRHYGDAQAENFDFVKYRTCHNASNVEIECCPNAGQVMDNDATNPKPCAAEVQTF